MRLNDHDEDRDESTLVLMELLAFLSLGDAEACEYLSWLDTDGTLTQVAINELGKVGIIPLKGFKPLAILSMASTERHYNCWRDPVPFLSNQAATAFKNFQVRITVSRLRRILEVVSWLHWRRVDLPEYPDDPRLLKLYRRYEQSEGAAIHADVFDVESFLVNPLWQAARAHAGRCMDLLGMTGSKPSRDIYRLSMAFED